MTPTTYMFSITIEKKSKSFLEFKSLTSILEPLHRKTLFGKGIATLYKVIYLLELVVFSLSSSL